MEQPLNPSADMLRVGYRIGQYEITSFLGAGGMGEVYAAHDHKLGRDVAVKVLPQRYSDDSARARRFAAEARTTGSVSHPNIVSVYDAGEIDGRAYLVTELLQGETLRALLERSGRLPVATAINYAVQIARGLAAAHGGGIVHRDLKPSNIFVTNDGHLKILDFGLAKLVRPEWTGADRDDETISVVSNPGTILGSVGYMSPEQVEARPADERSDIFALGAILHEMLAGERAFAGPSPVATLSSILKDVPPDLREARPEIPHALALIVARCLEKRPDDRMQSTRDIVFSLEQIALSPQPSFASIARAAVRLATMRLAGRPAVSAVAVAIAVGAAFIALAINWTSTEATRHDEPRRVPVAPPAIERITTQGKAGNNAALSPDGAWVAFDVEGELWISHVATRSATKIVSEPTFIEGPVQFSPDGNLIYFVAWDRATEAYSIHRVPILGGDPQLVARDVSADFVTFAPGGARIAFERKSEAGDALVVAASDGSGESVVGSLPKPASFLDCSWSPDGTKFLCLVWNEWEKVSMAEVDAATGVVRPLDGMPRMAPFAWLPDGRSVVGIHIVGHRSQIVRAVVGGRDTQPRTNDLSTYHSISVSRDGRTIASIRIDMTTNLWSLSPEGDLDLRQITSGVNTLDGNWGIATTPDGKVVWASGDSGKSADLVIANLDGTGRRRLTFEDDTEEIWPSVSPDGRQVVYMRRVPGDDGSSDLWRIDLDGTTPVRLTTSGDAATPRYSADGHWIYFGRIIKAERYAFRMPAEGGEAEQVMDEPATAPAPSPDGKWLMVGTKRGLELRPIDGDGEARVYKNAGLRHWRPDGRAFAFLRGGDGAGTLNLWVQHLDEEQPRRITSFPKFELVAWGFNWTRDGERIVFARRTQTRDVVILSEGR